MTEDLRVIKTNMALRKSFFELAKTKDFDAITINELCDYAMIRRSTFYRHYEDKFDYFQKLIQKLLKEMNQKHQPIYMIDKPATFYSNVILDMLNFLYEHNRLTKSVLGSHYFDVLANILYEAIYQSISTHLNAQKQAGYTFHMDLDYLAQFFAGGLIRIVYNWVLSGMKASIDDVMKNIAYMIENFFLHYTKKQP